MGAMFFCDYIADNTTDKTQQIELNREVLSLVTGSLGQLEVINSASCFDLPDETLADIRRIADEKKIHTLYFESYYAYVNRLESFRVAFPNQTLSFKTGIETFDRPFREKVLNKGIAFDSPEEVAKHFDSVCLLVGIKGQTQTMIEKDVDTLMTHFKRGCINIYVDNSTPDRKSVV